MGKGISLHIGINKYNNKNYSKIGKWLKSLPNCHLDAAAKCSIAERFKFNAVKILNNDATAESLLTAMDVAAKNLVDGDFFFLTFSGHGGRIEDKNGDEDDGYDESWCLYNRMVMDDELFERIKLFRPGVRILIIADSCHSGSVSKSDFDYVEGFGGRFPIQKADEVQATCILLAACQDKQKAYTGSNLEYSLYTYNMLKVLKEYDFCDSYLELHNRVSALMPKASTPNIFLFGPGAKQFAKKKPFKI